MQPQPKNLVQFPRATGMTDRQQPASCWIHIIEDLLHMKVIAEAALSTRLN